MEKDVRAFLLPMEKPEPLCSGKRGDKPCLLPPEGSVKSKRGRAAAGQVPGTPRLGASPVASVINGKPLWDKVKEFLKKGMSVWDGKPF